MAVAAMTQAAWSQSIGTVETLGGTGSPGYTDGVKGTSEFRAPAALGLDLVEVVSAES